MASAIRRIATLQDQLSQKGAFFTDFGPGSEYQQDDHHVWNKNKRSHRSKLWILAVPHHLLPHMFSLLWGTEKPKKLKIIWTLICYFPSWYFSIPFEEMFLLKSSIWKWGNWLFLYHSFTWAFIHCNYLSATMQHFLILCNALFN